MLKFEFVQPGEFDDPWYEVTDDENDVVGGIYFLDGIWWWSDSGECYLDAKTMCDVADKLNQLNGAK